MWFEDWFGTLVFHNESILAFNTAHRRIMRPARVMGHRESHEHIMSKYAGDKISTRSKTTAATDG